MLPPTLRQVWLLTLGQNGCEAVVCFAQVLGEGVV